MKENMKGIHGFGMAHKTGVEVPVDSGRLAYLEDCWHILWKEHGRRGQLAMENNVLRRQNAQLRDKLHQADNKLSSLETELADTLMKLAVALHVK
jgi:hypothetical protein